MLKKGGAKLSLKDELIQIRHQAHVTVVYQSEIKLRAKAPYKTLTKRALYKGVINKSHHQAAIDSCLERGLEPDIPLPEARRWGDQVGCLIEHKGKDYLAVTEVTEEEIHYYAEGQPVNPDPDWFYKRGEIVATRNFDLSKVIRLEIGDS